jgi:hypothetical protein
MNCCFSNDICDSIFKSNPYFRVTIDYDKSLPFCSQQCKTNFLKNTTKNDIDKNIFIEKINDECPICLVKGCMIELSCGHKLCHMCILKLFESTTICPMCRTIMLTKSETTNINEEYKQNLSFEHSKIIDIIYKLINSIDYEIDTDLTENIYMSKTNRDLFNDIVLIKDYLNLFEKKN